jgi:hypothetical protein
MTNEWGRRMEDKGQESPQVILARIDERVKTINEKLTVHIVSFEEHRKDDEKNFGGLYKTVYTGVGIALAIEFVVSIFKH